MSSLSNYRYTEQKKKDNAKAKLIGYLLSPFIGGLLFLWYNHVWIQLPIPYWKWCCISAAFMFLPNWISKPVAGILGAGAIFGQVLYWLNLVQLPLIPLGQ